MRFGFAMHGSRGDVQPGVAVASALAERGHDVTVAAPEDIAHAVSRTGLPTKVLCPDNSELLRSPLVKERLKSKNPSVRFKALAEISAFGAEMSEQVMRELADDADVLVTGLLAQERAATVAEFAGATFVPLHYCPIRANTSVDMFGGTPRWARRALWFIGDQVNWLTVRKRDNDLRRRLGLPPARRPLPRRISVAGTPEVQAYDAAFFPGLAAEWPARRPFAGALIPDEQTRKAFNGDHGAATDDTIAWAGADGAPVYVGFGSMPIERERLEHIVESLVGLGLRVIAHTDHDVPGGDAVLRVAGALDHEALLPHCRGAVHHGGAGTTSAVARAGIPAVIGWLSADQPMWTAAVRNLGVGGGRRLKSLETDDLRLLLDDQVIGAAAELATRLTPPDVAVAQCCDALEAAAN
ncbi:nucleotide disphospho-sugar-binding domain-containing protein [Gordonia sp. PKS22-38]|uniref:Nucleotide disphospho-sugar-binding domain-containing protein n=1 Tax=Gordonia prachuapensis TaxID=3115651 RepID=A0ABU7MTT6_9ACTN|nr:nucleotide disphospho-sugar-binding domain-containing protein [Gordonia sp. PKS22-38]